MKNLMAINELLNKRAAAVTQLQEMAAKAPLTSADDVATYNNVKAAITDYDAKIADLKALGDDETNFRLPQSKDDKHEGFRAFMRTGDLSKVQYAEVKGMDRTAESGGALVPKPLADFIWETAGETSPLLSICTRLPLISSALDIPVEGDDAEWDWTDEGMQAHDSETKVGIVTLEAHDATSLIKVTRQLVADSKFDVTDYVVRKAARGLASFLGKAAICNEAKDTKKMSGIKAAAAAVETDAADKVTYKDLSRLYMKPSQTYRHNGSFFASKEAITNIMTLSDANKQPIFRPAPNVGQPDMLMNCPLYEDANVGETAADVLFGDFKQYAVGMREDMVLQRLIEVYAGIGKIGYLFHVRIDGKVVAPKAFAVLKNKVVVPENPTTPQ